MAKKTAVKETKTRISPKQKLADYKTRAFAYIRSIRNPPTVNNLSVKAYQIVDGKKNMASVPVPELVTMVGMAEQFGKQVKVTVSGSGNDVKLDFLIQDKPTAVPTELY